MKKLVLTMAGLGLLAGASIASACTLSAWSSTSGTAPDVGGPGDTISLPRYSGICSMSADAGTEYVQDNSPAGEPRMIARFYFLATGTGSADIFTAYSDEGGTTPVFSIAYDSAAGVTVTSGTGTATVAAPGAGWKSVEVDWTSGGAVNLWVNSDATTDPADGTTTDSGSSTVESVQLGAIGGLGGFASFVIDDYESRRTTAIGRLPRGDANGDGTVALADAVLILREFLLSEYASGQPDTNEDGTVGLADAVIALRIFLNLPV